MGTMLILPWKHESNSASGATIKQVLRIGAV